MSKALESAVARWPAESLARLEAMSNFEKVALLNELAGNASCGGWEALKRQLKLIEDELAELKVGIEARDVHELRDGIADMLVTVYGLAHIAGTNADADMHEVTLSNLTKFDSEVEEEAAKTRAKYLRLGVETLQTTRPDPLIPEARLIVTRSAYDQNGTDGKRYPGGKWLKSANFVEPEFAPLSPQAQHALGLLSEEECRQLTAFQTEASVVS